MKNFYTYLLKQNATIKWLGGRKFRITWYYKNGNKHREMNYQNGKQHGKDIGWYENGNKHRERDWQNGKQHGKDIGWYENGNKHWEMNYQNGKLHGKAIG